MKFHWLTVGIVVAVAFLPLTQATPDEPGNAPTPAADPMRGTEPGEVRDDNLLKMKLVWCPAGTFMMGSATTEVGHKENEHQVEVKLTKGFWLGQAEVTQAQWKRLMETTPWQGKYLTKEGVDNVATHVSWFAAEEFCKRLTDQERKNGRLLNEWEYTLPTEAQWEYGCRAGTKTRYEFGDDDSRLGDYAWWGGLSRGGNAKPQQYAHKVGLKKANAWGLHDMHGNVMEWCRDLYQEKVTGGTDPVGRRADDIRVLRVIRSGAWCDPAVDCRSAVRDPMSPIYEVQQLGFRVARSPTQ